MFLAVSQDEEGEMQEILIPEYVDIGDEFDINDYYAIGDAVSALVLDGGLEEGRVALTHFTDADIQTDAIQMDIEGEEYGEEEVDPLAEDIEAMMLSAEEVAAIEAANESGEEVTLGAVVGDGEDMVQEFRSLQYNVVARAAGGLFRSAVNRNTVADFSPLAFPSRPLVSVRVNGREGSERSGDGWCEPAPVRLAPEAAKPLSQERATAGHHRQGLVRDRPHDDPLLCRDAPAQQLLCCAVQSAAAGLIVRPCHTRLWFHRTLRNLRTKADTAAAAPGRLSAMDVNTMAPFSLEEVDFDGDEMELNDYWAETVSMPKGALKKLGYKLVVSENGGVDVVEMDKPAVSRRRDSGWIARARLSVSPPGWGSSAALPSPFLTVLVRCMPVTAPALHSTSQQNRNRGGAASVANPHAQPAATMSAATRPTVHHMITGSQHGRVRCVLGHPALDPPFTLTPLPRSPIASSPTSGQAVASLADAARAVQVAEGEPAFEFENALDIYTKGDLDARVASWVADLTEPDEEEAELACRAMRRPLSSRYFAASVGPVISATMVKALRNKTGAGMMDCKKALVETEGDIEKSIEWLRKKGLSGADKKASRIATEGLVSTYIHPGSRIGVLVEVNCETDFVAASEQFQSLVSEIGMIIAASPEVTVVSPDEVSAEDLAKEREVQMGMEDLKARPEHLRWVNNLALLNQPSLRDNAKTVTEIVKEVIAALGENIQVRRFTRFKLGEGMEKKSNDFAAEVAAQMEAKAASEKPKPPPPAPVAVDVNKPVVQVSASLVKALREKTGAGMMDCKKALAENEANEEKAIEWLRVKGLAGADKKASRIATEGVILSYIHPGSRLGVLLEVNCETDFVAGSDKFQALVAGIAMQIAASREVAYVSAEDIPAEVFEREKLIEMGREDIKSKPEAIRLKIAEGRAKKIAADMALLDQQYLMDDTKTVGEAVKEAIVSIGEKISVRRFSKFTLGEGLEKKSNDFAAEVAAVTGAGKA
ncbi:MAG: hypothetical protein WDW38_004320 [Sanguina aurantia]